MPTSQDRPKLTGQRPPPVIAGFFTKLLAVAVGAVLLIGAFVFSMLLFAVVLSVGLVVWGYLWWKTRALRKVVRERMRAANAARPPAGATVIEGDYVRERDSERR